jgi:hypothetical protein
MATLTAKDRLSWERRLPEMVAPWTHWRLLGDGTLLADVSGDDLLGALAIIADNVETFRLITAGRVAHDATGNCVLQDKGLFDISRSSRFKAK